MATTTAPDMSLCHHVADVPAGTVPAAVLAEKDYGDGYGPAWVVEFHWTLQGLDRLVSGGICTGKGPRGLALAKRLQAATAAGVAVTNATVRTDAYGQTYVQATQPSGKYLNADLRRLGY